MILDAECLRPIHTVCNMVEPSSECQLVLRHFFNDSGIYCINVSMANDVSLASTSTKVRFDMGNSHTRVQRFHVSVDVHFHGSGVCSRLGSVLSGNHRHCLWCPGVPHGPSCGGLFLQVRADFSSSQSLSLKPLNLFSVASVSKEPFKLMKELQTYFFTFSLNISFFINP